MLLIESGAAKLAATMIEVGGLNEWHRLGGDFGKLKSHGSLTLVFSCKCCFVWSAGVGVDRASSFLRKTRNLGL